MISISDTLHSAICILNDIDWNTDLFVCADDHFSFDSRDESDNDNSE